MALVIKRDKKDSSSDLVKAIKLFVTLLKEQKEDDAVAALTQAAEILEKAKPGDVSHGKAVESVREAFEGDLELSSYILDKPNPESWELPEQLSQAGSRVLHLARRLR